MRSDAKKCVVFIGVKKVDSVVEEYDYLGTGFVVSVRFSKNGRFSIPYIVTAKHIADGLQSMGKDIFIRFSKKDGDSAIFRVKAEDVKWWFHPDEGTPCDVAILPLIITQEIHNSLDYAAIDSKTLLTEVDRMEAAIGEGDEVFTVGMFYFHQGDSQNSPIVRMGNIAMMPNEPIDTPRGRIEAYLVELRSISGLSGSPVFVLKPARGEITESGLYHVIFRTYLIGLISGHWEKRPDNLNIGITYVSPAKKILETIHRQELAEHRAELEVKHMLKRPPLGGDQPRA